MKGLNLDINALNAVGTEPPKPASDPAPIPGSLAAAFNETLARAAEDHQNRSGKGKGEAFGLDVPGKQKEIDAMSRVIETAEPHFIPCKDEDDAKRIRLKYYRARKVLQDRGVESLNTVRFTIGGAKRNILILAFDPDPSPRTADQLAEELQLSPEEIAEILASARN